MPGIVPETDLKGTEAARLARDQSLRVIDPLLA